MTSFLKLGYFFLGRIVFHSFVSCVKMTDLCARKSISIIQQTPISCQRLFLLLLITKSFANVVVVHYRCSIFRKISVSFLALFFARVCFCVLLLLRLKYIESAQLRVEYSIYSYRTYDTDTAEKSIFNVCQVSAEYLFHLVTFFVVRAPTRLTYQYYSTWVSKQVRYSQRISNYVINVALFSFSWDVWLMEHKISDLCFVNLRGKLDWLR